MTSSIKSTNIQDRFEHLLTVLSGRRFLQKEGLGNEVPFFICPFDATIAVDITRLQKQLINRLEHLGIRVLEINLYDLSIEILKAREIWDQILEIEATVSKDQLKELLQGVLDPEENLVPAIAKQLNNTEFDILFLTGVGEIFPIIRSHHVLNNLQSTAKEKPTLMFFPGSYTHSLATGASLDLFERLHDDKYYRAFNIFHCEA